MAEGGLLQIEVETGQTTDDEAYYQSMGIGCGCSPRIRMLGWQPTMCVLPTRVVWPRWSISLAILITNYILSAIVRWLNHREKPCTRSTNEVHLLLKLFFVLVINTVVVVIIARNYGLHGATMAPHEQ